MSNGTQIPKTWEQEVVITITDSGSYIPPEDLENIFQPFFTKGKADGTGLGLAICRRIIAEHGGAIVASSTHAAGTSFAIRITAI